MLEDKNNILEEIDLKLEISKYLSFWPYFLIFTFFSVVSAYIYLRYAEFKYETNAVIEILDKAQDSEMALPTAMTVFNRSMINLENEISILKSFDLNDKVVKILNSNIKFYDVGRVKSTEQHRSQWSQDLDLTFNIETDTLTKKSSYTITTSTDGNFEIDEFIKDEFYKNYKFQNNSTRNIGHKLPFDITFNKFESDLVKQIVFLPCNDITEFYRKNLNISKVGTDSDQLNISFVSGNTLITEEYINTLIYEFDKDGVEDRQLEYKRTMDFVDTRSVILSSELESIENRKLKFKNENNLFDIQTDATNNIKEKLIYDNELFSIESQKDLTVLLKQTLIDKEYDYLPVNIGIDSKDLNKIISEFNSLISKKNSFLITAGPKNTFVKDIFNQLDNYYKNILASIETYQKELDLRIQNISLKEKEFSSIYDNIPQNEKVLRSIDRELNIKEALFLLLLQKKEEASINFAVVKPSIKIIDISRSDINPISPNVRVVYLFSILVGLLTPFVGLFIWFYFDNKIHTKSDLSRLTDLPIIAEIPYIFENSKSYQLLETTRNNSRDGLTEGIRMLIANLKFTDIDMVKESDGKVVLVTSSIKGEGKTLISSRLSKVLSFSDQKTILVGADLRNPQLHKTLGIEKSAQGISDYIYKNDLDWKDLLQKCDNLDVLLSGTIPPNPTELLNSKKFKDLINELKKLYDYVIIDSAPCLLVADTLQFSNYVDNSLIVVRANHTEKEIISFISELNKNNKLKRINLVLNSVGNSTAYGYKYGYQYGYKYGYKYGYNYGYGYGYSEEK